VKGNAGEVSSMKAYVTNDERLSEQEREVDASRGTHCIIPALC
jgi:hypothetical protein